MSETNVPKRDPYADIHNICEHYREYNYIDPSAYERYNVKRGLRNPDGTGVMAGVTNICNVHGYYVQDGERIPAPGKIYYRGIDLEDIVSNIIRENRYGFEEVCYLLLFGQLPTADQLAVFQSLLSEFSTLPTNFAEDVIMRTPSNNLMNMLGRSILALYSYDPNPEDNGVENIVRQSIQLIARMPAIMVAAYQVKRRAFDHKSMYFHQPKKEFSIAQNILRTMRADKQFTEEEAHMLDLCLVMHAEHGGGNNSTFTTRVVSSTLTDTYSAISAGIGSLKGFRHGGANYKVSEMLEYIKAGVSDYSDGEVEAFLRKLVRKEAGDKSGLIYGMGHAVYTLSDPRTGMLKKSALKLAHGTEFEREFALLDAIERLAPKVFAEEKNSDKPVCANVDLYSGLIYRMLKIPMELNTPMFAAARLPGWCAHRLEEVVFGGRIMRPAYKPVMDSIPYVPITERGDA